MVVGAFFDLDGTIVKGTSGIRFLRFLNRRKILKMDFSKMILTFKLGYDYAKGNINKVMDDTDDLLAKYFKGIKKKIIIEQAMQYSRLELYYVYKKTLKIINHHKSKGHKLFLLSLSPDELVKELGKVLGFDEAVGTRFESKKGIYTGKLLNPSLVGKNRTFFVKEWAKKHDIDLTKSFAYGNCINDLPVLKMVGNPCAIKPNKYLRPVMEVNGWKIIQ